MRIYECADYRAMSRQAANIISAQVILKPDCVLGLATGSTPIGTYDQLVEWCEKKDLSFSKIHSVNLDEYRGLGGDHDQSYRWFMNHYLFSRVDIDVSKTNVPNGLAEDPDAECARYDALIDSLGGIDLQLLGLGRNGHIGFNEPDDVFSKGTHCVNLTESTIEANSRLFEREEDVPRRAYTMGVQTIMNGRSILVVANGEKKAQAVHDMCFGPVTPQCPASILQLHTNVTIVADDEALALCKDELA